LACLHYSRGRKPALDRRDARFDDANGPFEAAPRAPFAFGLLSFFAAV
jgi:hypothetical protein